MRIPLAAILGAWAFGSFAQTSVQANVFNELLIPTTPRAAVLAQTNEGLESLGGNPAALSLSTGAEALYGGTFYQGSHRDVGVHFLGMAHQLDDTSFGLTLTTWDVDFFTDSFCDVASCDNTVEENRNFLAVGGTLAHMFSDRLSTGVTLKGARLINRTRLEGQTTWKIDSKAIAIDAGISYILPETGIRFGVSVQNLGVTSSQFFGEEVTCDPEECPQQEPTAHLPTSISLSGAYTRTFARNLSLTAVASAGLFRKGNYQDQEGLTLAIEADYRNRFFLRGGINTLDDEFDLNQRDVWSAGIGFKIPIDPVELRVDYAFRPSSNSDFDGAHLLSMGVGF